MANFDYNVAGIVPAIAQPSTLSCWATVATMMISWRQNQSMTIKDAIAGVGEPYLGYFVNNRVLPWAEHDAFARAAGMGLEAPMCYTVEGLKNLLVRTNSPLFVVIAPAGNTSGTTHIVTVTGMAGDGTIGGTDIRFNDPDGGVKKVQTFEKFVKNYESAAGRPGLNAQIMHY